MKLPELTKDQKRWLITAAVFVVFGVGYGHNGWFWNVHDSQFSVVYALCCVFVGRDLFEKLKGVHDGDYLAAKAAALFVVGSLVMIYHWKW